MSDPQGASDKLVSVYTVKNAGQAEIIKNFLESEGIFCAIEGEGQIGLAGILDIKVMVRAADAEQARELIAEHKEAGAASDEEGDWDEEDEDEDAE